MVTSFDTASIVSLLVGTVLPLVIGLLTPASLNGGVKAVLLAALSAITAVLSSLLDALHTGAVWHWQPAVLAALATFAVAVGTHYQVWKPTGISATIAKVGVHDPAPELMTEAQWTAKHRLDPHAPASDASTTSSTTGP